MDPVEVNFRFVHPSAPSVSKECRSLTDNCVQLEATVWGRAANGFLEPIVGAEVVVTIDDGELAELTHLGEARWDVYTRRAGKSVLRARHGELTGEMSLEVLEAGVVRRLWVRLEGERLGVYAEDDASGFVRRATPRLGLGWQRISGDLEIDGDGAVRGAGVAEARVGAASIRAAVALRGEVVWLLTTEELWYPWMAGNASPLLPTLARSDRDEPQEGLSLFCSDEQIARVHGIYLHPVAAGTATVRLRWEGLSLELALRVEAPPINRLEIHTNHGRLAFLNGRLYMALDEKLDFSVGGWAEDNRRWSLDLVEYVKYTISSPVVALVRESFGWLLRADHPGSAEIVARCAGLQDELRVVVYDPAELEINWY